MENASNALIITAGILISLIIISLGTYLFLSFGNYSKQINKNLSQTQIDEFNSKFTKFETDDGDETTYRTIYDVVSAINLAKDHNEKYDFLSSGTSNSNDISIQIKLNGTPQNNTDNLIEFNNDADDNGKIKTKYKCSIEYGNTGLVKFVNFYKL